MKRDWKGRFSPPKEEPKTDLQILAAGRDFVRALEDAYPEEANPIDIAIARVEIFDRGLPTERHSYRARFTMPVPNASIMAKPIREATEALAVRGYQWGTSVGLDLTMHEKAEYVVGVWVLCWVQDRRKGQTKREMGTPPKPVYLDVVSW